MVKVIALLIGFSVRISTCVPLRDYTTGTLPSLTIVNSNSNGATRKGKSAEPRQLQGERIREKVWFRSAAAALVRSFAISSLAFSQKVGSESDRHFRPLRGAFREVFYCAQKATLGTSLALKLPRRPLQPSGRQYRSLPAPFAAFRSPSAVLQRSFPLRSESDVRHYSLTLKLSRRSLGSTPVFRRLSQPSGRPAPSFGPLPGAFREVFYCAQKTALGTSLALKWSRRPLQPSGRQHPGLPPPFAPFRSPSAVFWSSEKFSTALRKRRYSLAWL